jgi:hypothetical protein
MVKRKRGRRIVYLSDSDDEFVSYRRKVGRKKRTGEMARLTIGELKEQAREVLPIYELLEDSVAVEKFLKTRISEFTYLQDKFSQMPVSEMEEYWRTVDNATKLTLYLKIVALYVSMKKIAKEVCKEIKKEYTSTIASKYTQEKIMLIFRKAVSGVRAMKGRGKFGTTNKCPTVLLSQRQQVMRQELKGIKVGSQAARDKMAQINADDNLLNGGSASRSWKKCVTALEAIVLDPTRDLFNFGRRRFIIDKKWGVKFAPGTTFTNPGDQASGAEDMTKPGQQANGWSQAYGAKVGTNKM